MPAPRKLIDASRVSASFMREMMVLGLDAEGWLGSRRQNKLSGQSMKTNKPRIKPENYVKAMLVKPLNNELRKVNFSKFSVRAIKGVVYVHECIQFTFFSIFQK